MTATQKALIAVLLLGMLLVGVLLGMSAKEFSVQAVTQNDRTLSPAKQEEFTDLNGAVPTEYDYTPAHQVWNVSGDQFIPITHSNNNQSVRLQQMPYEIIYEKQELWLFDGQRLHYFPLPHLLGYNQYENPVVQTEILLTDNTLTVWTTVFPLPEEEFFRQPEVFGLPPSHYHTTAQQYLAKFDLPSCSLTETLHWKDGALLGKQVVGDTLVAFFDTPANNRKMTIRQLQLTDWTELPPYSLVLADHHLRGVVPLEVGEQALQLEGFDFRTNQKVLLSLQLSDGQLTVAPQAQQDLPPEDTLQPAAYWGFRKGMAAADQQAMLHLSPDGSFLLWNPLGKQHPVCTSGRWQASENQLTLITQYEQWQKQDNPSFIALGEEEEYSTHYRTTFWGIPKEDALQLDDIFLEGAILDENMRAFFQPMNDFIKTK